MRRFVLPAAIGGLLLSCASLSVGALAAGTIVDKNNAAMTYGPAGASLPKGVTLSVIQGNPAKPGPFVLRVDAPANTIILPHTHKTAETLTVISGSIYHAVGSKTDRATGKLVQAGGFVYLPAGTPHYLWTTGAPAVLQVNGTGPFGVDYVAAN